MLGHRGILIHDHRYIPDVEDGLGEIEVKILSDFHTICALGACTTPPGGSVLVVKRRPKYGYDRFTTEASASNLRNVCRILCKDRFRCELRRLGTVSKDP